MSVAANNEFTTVASDPLYPFHFSFNSLPYTLAKKVAAKVTEYSPAGQVPVAFKRLAERLSAKMKVCLMGEGRLGLLAVTSDGEKFGIQFVRSV